MIARPQREKLPAEKLRIVSGQVQRTGLAGGDEVKRLGFVFAGLVLGAVCFWAPTVVLSPPTTSERTWWITASLVSPVVLLIFCGVAVRYRKGRVGGPSSCLFALAGVWLTGPWFMALAAALRTPEIVRGMTLADYALLCLMSVFPPFTLYLSAGQGSAYALVLATVLMPICHRVLERDRWFIPPELKLRLHLSRSHPTTDPKPGGGSHRTET